MCNCCKTTLPPIKGCADQIKAECVQYTTDLSVKQILDSHAFPVFIPALITYLNANPTVKNLLKAALV